MEMLGGLATLWEPSAVGSTDSGGTNPEEATSARS